MGQCDNLDGLDRKILHIMLNNARRPYLEVARECSVSGAAIHQHIQKMTDAGVILGAEFVVDSIKVGYDTCAYMGINLQNPEESDQVVEALRQIPEVVECHYTTGEYDLFVKIYAQNNRHLLQIIQTRLQPLGLAKTETLISFKEGFRRNLPISE